MYLANYSRVGSFLTKYGTNLNKVANEGKLDPVIGRQEEIERCAYDTISSCTHHIRMYAHNCLVLFCFVLFCCVMMMTDVLSAIQILGKRTKNNPILIGEPGVGI